MPFDLEMIKKVYAALPQRIQHIRNVMNKPLTLTEKILYFNEGWMEFILHFDEQSRLRRIYIQHRQIETERGIEIPLK